MRDFAGAFRPVEMQPRFSATPLPPEDMRPDVNSPDLAARLTKPPQQRGMLGALGSGIGGMFQNAIHNPHALEILGATLRQLGAPGSNTLTDLIAQLDHERDQQMQRTWQQTMQEQQVGAWNSEDKQNRRYSDWAATQDPEAQVDPEAAYRSYMQRRQPAQWEHMYGRAGRINPDGSVELGGRIPERPPSNVSLFGTGTDAPPGDGGDFGSVTVNAPPVGTIEDGYRFNGGDPANPSSWTQVR